MRYYKKTILTISGATTYYRSFTNNGRESYCHNQNGDRIQEMPEHTMRELGYTQITEYEFKQSRKTK